MSKNRSTTSRRGFLGALAVSGATLAASRAGAAPDKLDLSTLKKDTDVACLYHWTSAIRSGSASCSPT